MNLSNQTILLIIIIVVLFIIFIYINYYSDKPIVNEGIVSLGNNDQTNVTSEESDSGSQYTYSSSYNSIPTNQTYSISEESPSLDEESIYRRKTTNKNMARDGKYKKSSYKDGERGNYNDSEFEKFFDENNRMVNDVYADNEDVQPNNEGENLAEYTSRNNDNNRKPTDEELYDVQALLPQEENPDWFDVMPEPISCKNRHLINISRPMGINTIGTSNKNANYDIRGTIPNPKHVVSPFLNSSIEPDLNNKGLSC